MPGIEHVVASYEASYDSMKQRFGGTSDLTEATIAKAQIAGAEMRLAPVSFSLDIAWQQRLQSFTDSVVNDPTRGAAEGPDKLLLRALDKLAGTKIDQRLTDWLVVADPFEEKPDPNAIAERGAKLLESLESCFEVADERADTRQLQPDLMALTEAVRARMTGIIEGTARPDSPALSVPHQMYLELQGAISLPIDALRDKVRTAAEKAGDDPDEAETDWQNGVQEKVDTITTRYPKNPGFLWSLTCENVLPRADTNTQGRNFQFTKIFESRNFRDQLIKFDAAANPKKMSIDHVMRVREAAWPVQETIKFYLDAIEKNWGPGQGDLRTTLEQTLCAMADRVLKEVNFVISSKLARGA